MAHVGRLSQLGLLIFGNGDEQRKGGTAPKLPPFFFGTESGVTDVSDESWEICPNTEEDPRYDRHGFRRDASRLAREQAFDSVYVGRLEQQEARWSRRVGSALTLESIDRSELKRLVRQGIPAERRCTVWPQLCRATELRASAPDGYFEALLARPAATNPKEPTWAAERQIDLDVARTFPGHRMLSSPEGTRKLRSVLVAYARRAPSVGYVQGMGFVAAALLVFVEEAEAAFWCLCAVVEWLLPDDYYSTTLLGLRTEQV